MLFQRLLSVFGISIDDASPGKFSIAFQFGRQLSGCGFVLKTLDPLSCTVLGFIVDLPEG